MYIIIIKRKNITTFFATLSFSFFVHHPQVKYDLQSSTIIL